LFEINIIANASPTLDANIIKIYP